MYSKYQAVFLSTQQEPGYEATATHVHMQLWGFEVSDKFFPLNVFARPTQTAPKLYMSVFIAKRLSMRLIIVQAWWALVGSYSGVVHVCMSVCNGFMIWVYTYLSGTCCCS